VLQSGETAHVRVGTVVDVTLVEPEYPRPFPSQFPWMAVAVSNHSVLARLNLCRPRTLATLPLRATAFRAIAPGAATLVANLTTAWRGVAHGPGPYLAHVVVSP
jgi:hypothetical protein